MNEGMNRQLLRLTTLLQLEQRARRAETAQELGFVIANETHSVVAYRQAVLWRPGAGEGTVLAVSGAAVPDAYSPYVTWMRRLAARLQAGEAKAEIKTLTAEGVDADLAGGWSDWLAPYLLRVPLSGPRGTISGVLFLARAEPWSEFDRQLFVYLGEAFGHALAAHVPRRAAAWLPVGRRRRAVIAGGAVVLALLMALPVRQSVLAPAEVVARTPILVRAPFEGVVDNIAVEPNAPVRQGDLLLTLDQTRLKSRLDIARKAREVAEAEYRSAVQQAVFDSRIKASLIALQGKLDQQTGEVTYLEELLARTEVRAEQDGVLVFEDRNDWLGRPVALGERIMLLADPDDIRLDIHVPVADAIGFPEGSEVLLFLNTAPDRPVDAKLESHSFRATATPDGTLAYRLKAGFAGDDARAARLRIGLKGTAKIYAGRAPLALYLFRRPVTVVRQWLGL